MPSAIKPLGQVQLGVALTTIYTAPSQPVGLKTVVQVLWITNTANAGRTFTLRVGTGALTIANSLFEVTAIAASATAVYGSNAGMVLVLSAGQTLQGLGSVANDVVVSVYGEEFS